MTYMEGPCQTMTDPENESPRPGMTERDNNRAGQ